jgi:uncharacterized protein YndB with AHSA1/START domain
METIRKQMEVAAPQGVAFKVFTENIDTWWPRTHHIGSTPMTALVLEPGRGGRWYSLHEDGTEANVGKVLHWQPTERVVLAWQINGNFKYDPGLVTEVEIVFIDKGNNKTLVQFEHRNLDRLGEGKAVESMDQGWGQILELYKKTTSTHSVV